MTVTFHPLPLTAQCIPELGKSALKSKTSVKKHTNVKEKEKKNKKKGKKLLKNEEKKKLIDKANSDLTMAEVYH